MPDTVKIDINLIDPIKKRAVDPMLIFLLVIMLASTILFYLYSAWLDSEIARRRDQARTWDQKIEDAKKDLPQITRLKDENNRLRTQIEVVKSLSHDPVRYGNILYELGHLVPSTIWISSVNVDTAQYAVALSGTAVGPRPLGSIADFMRSLQGGSRYFRDASLTSTSASAGDTGPGFTFQVEAHYDPQKSTQPWDQVQPGSQHAGETPALRHAQP